MICLFFCSFFCQYFFVVFVFFHFYWIVNVSAGRCNPTGSVPNWNNVSAGKSNPARNRVAAADPVVIAPAEEKGTRFNPSPRAKAISSRPGDGGSEINWRQMGRWCGLRPTDYAINVLIGNTLWHPGS
eukprot:Selendium_serpulae@DN6427_c1_g1_i6.p1